MKKRLVSVLAVATLLGTLVTGCGQAASSEAAPANEEAVQEAHQQAAQQAQQAQGGQSRWG